MIKLEKKLNLLEEWESLKIDFKAYLRDEKVRWIQKFNTDFNADFGIDLPHGSGFTRSSFFHFAVVDGIKYVHKGAMKFVLTNGDTYFEHQRPSSYFSINNNLKEKNRIDLNVVRMFDFFRNDINQYKLFPKFLSETDNFFLFKFYSDDEWTKLKGLTLKDSDYIRTVFIESFRGTNEVVTPFYNQMLNKILRNDKSGEIIMVDLKSLEFRLKAGLAIYMHDEQINDLYLLERRFWTKSYILKPYAVDYPVQNTILIKHY